MSAQSYGKLPNHLAHNAGDTWTQSDDAAIMAADRPADADLCVALGRTRQAIHMRRYELGGTTTPARAATVVTKRETAEELVARIDPRMAVLLYG